MHNLINIGQYAHVLDFLGPRIGIGMESPILSRVLLISNQELKILTMLEFCCSIPSLFFFSAILYKSPFILIHLSIHTSTKPSPSSSIASINV
jgi:hypothetical protein